MDRLWSPTQSCPASSLCLHSLARSAFAHCRWAQAGCLFLLYVLGFAQSPVFGRTITNSLGSGRWETKEIWISVGGVWPILTLWLWSVQTASSSHCFWLAIFWHADKAMAGRSPGRMLPPGVQQGIWFLGFLYITALILASQWVPNSTQNCFVDI